MLLGLTSKLPSSALYGPNAHSGVINIITKRNFINNLNHQISPSEEETSCYEINQVKLEGVSQERLFEIITTFEKNNTKIFFN